MDASQPRPGALGRIGLLFRRVATYLYGPPDLPDEVDPLVQIDEQLGLDPRPTRPPKPTRRQQAYDDLPKGHE